MSAFVGAAAAREIVATEVKEVGEQEGGEGEEELVVEPEGVVCFVGCREVRERGQEKRSW